jgi:FKBP-type peptidyl-prolyl cis-trans isomerase FkpA
MRLSAFALFLALGLTLSACSGGSETPTSPTVNVPFSTVDVRVGTGAEANTGRTVSVNYAGYFYSATAPENKGNRFDAGPYSFLVGGGQVIQGFNQGVIGMRVGGLRRVTIPPSLAYGSQGSGTIPPNSTLVFDLELLSVQ